MIQTVQSSITFVLGEKWAARSIPIREDNGQNDDMEQFLTGMLFGLVFGMIAGFCLLIGVKK